MKLKNIHIHFFLFIGIILILGCTKDNDINIDDPVVQDSSFVRIIIDDSYQSMIGFGGALSWYCDRIIKSNKKEEIIDLMVNDLGMDILRLKNWYYPKNYPDNKVPNEMETSWFISHFDATDELYSLVKAANPEISILFSSWGPTSYLKNNGKLDHGTLKKQDGEFMYDEYAEYWVDVLNNISFVPDYLSIQNEPTWLADWTTCEWAAKETASLPSYEIAFDKVAEKLMTFGKTPTLVGPESANVSYNAFHAFANELKDNPNLGAYAYHLYNFNENSSLVDIKNTMRTIGNNYSNHPRMMTEYSGFSWMKTAQVINANLREGNAEAYIYWTLMWAEDSEDAMIKVKQNGDYELTEFYYLLKHYAKFIDKDYVRIGLISEEDDLDQLAFINPEGNKLVLITVNPSFEQINSYIDIEGKKMIDIEMYQSTEESPFNQSSFQADSELRFEGNSISTLVINIE